MSRDGCFANGTVAPGLSSLFPFVSNIGARPGATPVVVRRDDNVGLAGAATIVCARVKHITATYHRRPLNSS